MPRPTSVRSTLVLAALAVVALSGAQVTSYDMFTVLRYTQISTRAPERVESSDFTARIFAGKDDEVLSGTLSRADMGQVPLRAFGVPRAIQFRRDFRTRNPEGDMDAAFPSGVYDYAIDAGSLGGTTGSIRLPDPVRSIEVPFLDAQGYLDLQDASAAQPVTVTWKGYSLPKGTGPNQQLIFFRVVDLAGGVLLEASGPNGIYQSQTITDLRAGHTYEYTLTYSPRFRVERAGFGGAASFVGFDRATSGRFTVQS